MANELSREDKLEIDKFIQQRPKEIIKHLQSMSKVYIDATHIAKRTDKFRYYHKQVVAKINQLIESQAEPSEELIEEKVVKIFEKHGMFPTKKMLEIFIEFAKELPMRKPKASKEWTQTLIDICEDVREGEMSIENLYEMLEDAGMEVEE